MILEELFWLTATAEGESGCIALKLNTQYTVPLDSVLKKNNTKGKKKEKSKQQSNWPQEFCSNI